MIWRQARREALTLAGIIHPGRPDLKTIKTRSMEGKRKPRHGGRETCAHRAFAEPHR